MPKKRSSRIYTMRGRYYGDFRDFADVGGKREALRPEGQREATADVDVATKLASDRIEALKDAREAKARGATNEVFGIVPRTTATLAAYAARHLDLKAQNGEGVESWLAQAQRHLETAGNFFGTNVDLLTLTSADMTRYVDHLRTLDNGRGGKLGDTSVRKYLNSLSNLFARAVSEQRETRVIVNPVAAMYSKPTETKVEAEYLEPEEAALLLEAAWTYRPAVDPVEQAHGGAIAAHQNPHLFPILATFLLTGGRKSEVLGLDVDDVSFQLGRIYFRTNEWRRLKTKGSKRSVPLWPQLRAILEEYFAEREREGGLGSLLFPSVGGRPRSRNEGEGGEEVEQPAEPSGERMIVSLERALDTIGERAGFPAGHVRLHMLRHTYTAARIQTLDRGVPIALYSVARELGHSGTDMIEDRYGHLHDRAVLGGSDVVEFQVEHYREKLGDRLTVLEAQEGP